MRKEHTKFRKFGKKNMPATMKDVAAHAQVALGTVSSYISGSGNVSQEKGKRIEAAIKELDYKVNLTARALRTNSTKTIGVLIPDFGNAFIIKVISCIEMLLNEKGYSLMLVSYNFDTEREKEQLEFLSIRSDGIIYMPHVYSDPNIITGIVQNTPVVTFNEMIEGVVCDQVLVDNFETVRDLTTLLIHKGYERIGIITGPQTAYTTKQRLEGYKHGFRDNHLALNEQWIKYGDYTKQAGAELANDLLEEGLSSIIVIGYSMTLGALSQLKRFENPPLLLGYDASDIADIVPLGYVYQPYDEIAQNIASLILQRISKDMNDFPKIVQLKAQLKNIEIIPEIDRWY